MKLRNFLLAVCIVTILLSLSGCLSTEERTALSDFQKEAVQYYKDKYGEKPRIEKCNYIYDHASVFPRRTDDIYAQCVNGEYIIYDAVRDIIVDNRQSEETDRAIRAELNKEISEIEKIIANSEIKIEEYSSSAYYSNRIEGNFYHAYFDGDIEEFIQDEDIQLYADMSLICQKEDAWQEVQKECQALIRNKFRTHYKISLTVLNEECYEKHGTYAGIEHEGCWAEFRMDKESTEKFIQNYIKVVDGIYVTCNEMDFVFEDGDVQMQETITEQELNNLIFERYDKLPDKAAENANGSYNVHDKTREQYSVVQSSSPIYQLVFSNRVREAFPDGTVAMYFMFKPEEAVCEDGDCLVKYTNKEDVWRCFYLTQSDDNISTWQDANENDYYFIGSYEMQGAGEEE